MLSVSAAARDSGSKLAVIAGERRLTFEELKRQVEPLAETLSRLAPSPNTPIAFVAYPNFESLLLVYALLELENPAFPMNPRLLAAWPTKCWRVSSPAIVGNDRAALARRGKSRRLRLLD